MTAISIPSVAATPRVGACTSCQQPVARHFDTQNRAVRCADVLKVAGAPCGYCGHTRGEHDRPEPGNPAPGLRCGRGCVCAAFIESDGRPEWMPKPDPKGPLDLSGWELVGTEPASGGGAYEIRRSPDGTTYGCTCKGYSYRSTCKHVERFTKRAAK